MHTTKAHGGMQQNATISIVYTMDCRIIMAHEKLGLENRCKLTAINSAFLDSKEHSHCRHTS